MPDPQLRPGPSGHWMRVMAEDDALKLCAFVDWLAERGYYLAKNARGKHGGIRIVPISPVEAEALATEFQAACVPPEAPKVELDMLNIGSIDLLADTMKF